MTESALLIKTHVCRDGKKIGQLTLNNPKALNALSIAMVLPMREQLQAWSKDEDIIAVIIDGAGSRGFCAGGDLRDVYQAMKSSDEQVKASASQYFVEEYRLDYMIHTYPKPIVIWGSGIVMGGGMGLFMAGDVRIVTDTTRIAMPEITIALFPDVGASYFLNQLPNNIGQFLALTGSNINAKDALSLGLANSLAEHDQLEEIISFLQEQTWAGDKEEDLEIITEIVDTFATEASEKLVDGLLEPHIETIDRIFSETDTKQLLDRFLQESFKSDFLTKAQQTLASGSPLHALIIHRQLQESVNRNLIEVFQSEARLSTNIVGFTEFSEGIRALLIDKDRQPNWHFKNYHDIEDDFVSQFFKEPWTQNPLHDLS